MVPPNPEQATDPTDLKSYDGRVTAQLGQNRLTGSYSYGPRNRQHFGIENRGGTPESFAQYPNKASVTQVKLTSTLNPHLLFEAGFSRIWWWALLEAQDRTKLATCFVAFAQCPAGTDYGDIRKRDLTLGWNYNAPTTFGAEYASPRNSYMSSLSYVTGAHNTKIGFMWDTGYRTITTPMNNGGLQQQYRQGVPDSVVLQTVPTVQDTAIDREVSVYAQDSWTLGRMTLNPGLRFEHIKGSIRDQTAPAGRFLPLRVFTQADYVEVPMFSDFSPRFGVAYDLFGKGKTALKANFGKYVQSFSSNLGDDYNPNGGGTDTRTWRDVNGDDIAAENELGPSTNLNFGKPANVTRPDPNSLDRPYQLLYSAGVQQEILPGFSGSVNYYYRKYYNDFWVDNIVTTAADYSTIVIPDPRNNGQSINVYSIAPAKLGVIDNVRYNSSENGREYQGIDLSFNARLRNATQLQGGITTGKLHEHICQVDDPNSLRYCDGTYPFLTQYKLSGTYSLPWKFRLSGLFQSLPGVQSARDGGNVGKDLNIIYSVGRAIAPGLTQTTVNVRLNEPGTVFLDRVNQVDFAFSRDFQAGRVRIRPQVDIFNALNNNAITQVNTNFGPSLLQPQSILNPRLIRLNVRITY